MDYSNEVIAIVPLPHQEYSIIYLPQLHMTNIRIVSNNDYIYTWCVIIIHTCSTYNSIMYYKVSEIQLHN